MNKYFTPEFEIKIKEACSLHLSMAAACASLGMNHNTFIVHAKRLNCYDPNPSGKGMPGESRPKYSTEEILQGTSPHYQSHKLKIRLIKEGIKEHKCENCNNTTWLNKPIPLELHHKDGNHHNNLLNNLELLCPNCHSLTLTFSKKKVVPAIGLEPTRT